MARTIVKLPKMGDTADEVVIVRWLVAPGIVVGEGTPLLLVETAKAEVEVPSPVEGVLLEQLVNVDEEIPTGTPLCVIDR